MPDQQLEVNLLEVTSRIVTAHVSNNTVAPADLPRLIITVHQALTDLGEETPSSAEPAVSIKRSVRPDYIICLDDGKKFKMLKRHLRTTYNMSPEDYRAKWNLPSDYPMVAPEYAEQRSELAKKIGLGRSLSIRRRISRNSSLGPATSANWNMTQRPWLTTLAPIFTSFSRSVVSDHVCEKGRMSAMGHKQT